MITRQEGILYLEEESGEMLATRMSEAKKKYSTNAAQTHIFRNEEGMTMFCAFVYHYGERPKVTEITSKPVRLVPGLKEPHGNWEGQ